MSGARFLKAFNRYEPVYMLLYKPRLREQAATWMQEVQSPSPPPCIGFITAEVLSLLPPTYLSLDVRVADLGHFEEYLHQIQHKRRHFFRQVRGVDGRHTWDLWHVGHVQNF